jgi:hypothetical protein
MRGLDPPEYMRLVEKTKANFRITAKAPLVLDLNSVVLDGQHRLCAAMHLYNLQTLAFFSENLRFKLGQEGRLAKVICGNFDDPDP